ncbi:EhSec31, putative [Entamoeba histolytica HM-3:IMSS]|uniref:EhSec31, putative n=1 Tax=Entamoeba histolytica HM-3:IMSS TaxID=885315 RepID=M7X9Y4_ENTHI|nr:EhSec31, putative [Entamoeba histolytica HM-3:IMSS]
MSKTATLEKRGTICWSPKGNLLAIGTTADTIDEDFDSSSFIEIYEISSEAKLIKKVSAQNRFYKLTWGPYEGYENGIIAVSNDESKIVLYDVSKILEMKEEEDVEKAKIIEMETKEVIYDIQFHPSQNQLVAGGACGEFIIYDISDLKNIQFTQPEQKTQADIKCVNWNVKVPHIIALTLSTGSIVIFDCKKKKNIMTFNDKTHANWKGACWVPTEKTTIVTISDSEEKPVQLWDVRNTMAPVRVFEGHKAPVWSINFSKTDPNIFATTGQDKTAIWNFETGKIICEFPSQENVWDTFVQWSSQEGRMCTCGLDGFINFYTISDYGDGKHPKWMERTSGCTFGFGGKMGIFKGKEVLLKKMVGTVSIKKMEKGEIEELCVKRSETCQGDEQETWKLISGIVCKDDKAVMKITGFEGESVKEKVNEYYKEKRLLKVDEIKEKVPQEKEVNKAEIEEDDDPFEHIGEEEEIKENTKGEIVVEEVHEEKYKEDTVEDKIIEELVVSGEIDKAVEFCIKTKRFADALVMTENNKEMHSKVIEEYKKEEWNKKKSLNIVNAVMEEKLEKIVEECKVEEWKFVLYAICIHANVALKPVLIVRLGDKLYPTNKHAALICYIASGNVNKLIDIWIDASHGIEEVIERIEILRSMCGHIQLTDSITTKIVEHATQLASMGELNAAQKLIECLGAQQNNKTKELVDRIYYAQGAQGTQPVCPYKKVIVGSVQQPHIQQPTAQQPSVTNNKFFPPVPASSGVPTLPTIPQPTLPNQTRTQPVLPQIPVIPTPVQPVMPTIPQPVLPSAPKVNAPISQPLLPQVPAPVVQPVMPPVPTPVVQPTLPTIPTPVVQPAIPSIPKVTVPVSQPTMPVMPQANNTTSSSDGVIDVMVCDELKKVLEQVTSNIETKSKGTTFERPANVALKKASSFAGCIDKIPADIAKQFINLFNDLLEGKVGEAEQAFKKLLVNKQTTQYIPASSVASVKYVVDVSKQMK